MPTLILGTRWENQHFRTYIMSTLPMMRQYPLIRHSMSSPPSRRGTLPTRPRPTSLPRSARIGRERHQRLWRDQAVCQFLCQDDRSRALRKTRTHRRRCERLRKARGDCPTHVCLWSLLLSVFYLLMAGCKCDGREKSGRRTTRDRSKKPGRCRRDIVEDGADLLSAMRHSTITFSSVYAAK